LGGIGLNTESKKLVISATFSVDFLLPSLEYYNDKMELGLSIHPVPYNQVFQQLVSPDSIMNNNDQGFNVILLRFADWLRFQEGHAIQAGGKIISDDERLVLESSYNSLVEAIHSYYLRNQSRTLILVCPSSPSGAYAGDWQRVFFNYRERLFANLEALSAIKCLDAEDFHEFYDVKRVYDPIGDMMGHIPFDQDYVHLLGALIIRCYYGLHSSGRKVIVADGDNTLWNGICGEVGASNINWDGNAGKLQQFLVNQSNQGMLICLCSKNSEADVREVFEAHPDMPLRSGHITASRVNWEPKSENIKALAAELNLGLDSFIFIDDNQIECSEVSMNCPGVLTIHWPLPGDDPVKILSQLWIFDHWAVTTEDKDRTRMYQAEITRRQAGQKSGDWRRFIEELGLEVDIEPVNGATIERVSQLTMRTNQFNFTTVRRSVGDIQMLQQSGNFECYIARAQDRFGAYGIVGVIILLTAKTILTVDTFLLSCRVLGRGVEHRMMRWIAEEAIRRRIKRVRILFQDTDRNMPAKKFLDRLGEEYSGVLDNEGAICFSAKKLLECRYTDYSAADFKETKEPESSKSRTSAASQSPSIEKLIDFWFQNRTIDLLAKEIDSFRKKSPLKTARNHSRSNSAAGKQNRVAAPTQRIKEVFCKYTAIQDKELTGDFLLESLSLDSKNIVSITSELNVIFDNIPPTLLFECQTFGAVCDFILGKQVNGASSFQSKNKITGSEDIDNLSIPSSDYPAAAKNEEVEKPGSRDIAIIGISCRYPDAQNVYEFWDNLVGGKCSIKEIPEERWDNARFFSEDESEPCKSYNKWGGFIDGIAKFDATFFKISPRQAALMDPQQRLLLEVVWNLLEDAGYHPERFDKKTGVFVGVISSDYGIYQNWLSLGKVDTFRNCDYYQIANRISYFFDLHGPSIAIDTACSASGTALHLACESLLAKGCNCAIVGGVNLIVHPSRYIQYSHVGMLSRDDRCRPFGDAASGAIIGEGIGALLLKPYHKAIRDGDHIWGVIKGSAVNSGGRTTGFTVPNPLAQTEVVSEALQSSGIDPGTISYVEAHGTGTALGDPIEIKGLESAFQSNAKFNTGGRQYCAIGSVKSNIGHLESGAAVAGVIKVLLQMKYHTLVPSLNAEVPNPKIDFKNSPFKIQHKAGPWTRPVVEADGKPVVFPLRAGVSSFGAGGSNAHIILEEAYHIKDTRPDPILKDTGARKDQKYLILLSSRDDHQLIRYAQKMLAFLRNNPLLRIDADHGPTGDYTIENIAYTLRTGRKAMEARLAIVVHSIDELVAKLESVLNDDEWNDGKKDGPGKGRQGIYRGRKNEASEITGLISGNAGRAFLETAVSENNLDKLAQYWIAGGEIPDDVFIYQSKPQRLSLPGYPFDGPGFWMEDCDLRSGGYGTDFETGIKTPEVDFLSRAPQISLFQKSWEKAEKSRVSLKSIPGDILIVGGNRELNSGLIRYFQELGEFQRRMIIMATKKDLPPLAGEPPVDVYLIKSYTFTECSNITNRLMLENRKIGHVIHLGAFSTDSAGGIQESFFSVFAICRQLMRSKPMDPCQFLCIYPGTREADDPYWGGISGFGKTIREENPAFDFRAICIHLSQNKTDSAGASQIPAIIKRELFEETAEPEIDYDGIEKWRPCFKRIDLEAREANSAANPVIVPHEGGTYLITGGSGRIGFAVAGYLASVGRCNIVLCGRTPLDSGKILKLKRLSDAGATAQYLAADLSKKQDVHHLIRNIIKQYGKINGIFHCAGAIRDSFIIKKETAEIEAVLGPKVRGSLLLDAATRDQDLDFFVLFSSLSGVLGSGGQSDYAYANRFLDSFRVWRNKLVNQGARRGVTISINWPYWQDGGMRMAAPDRELFMSRTGLKPLSTALGIEILKTILSLRIEHAIPGYGDAEQFSQALNPRAENGNTGLNGPDRQLNAAEPGNFPPEWNDAVIYQFTREFLQNILGEVIKMKPEEISEALHFETLGIDSITVRLFSHQVEKKIGKVSQTLLYECQSLNDLIGYFITHYRNQLEVLFSSSAGGNTALDSSGGGEPPVTEKTGFGEKNGAREFKTGNDSSFPIPAPAGVSSRERCRGNEKDIAVIGMSGCYPLARDLMEYWQNLKNGRDCITRIPADRWNNQRYYSPDLKAGVNGKYYCQWGGFLESVNRFDPLFFNIAPKDARAMDPQERLFLQLAWMALEDAGYNREELCSLAGAGAGAPVGVFVGVTSNDYQLLGAEKMGEVDVIGHSLSWSIANRVSYCLNLRGPSIPVDGACSSSLMAVHLAGESLKRGECEAAIAGAVHLNLHPFKYILNSQQRMLSTKGRCFAFSAEADGFVPAEGAGVFILKRFDKALEHGDHIYALIKGTAINHGGRSNGYMAPNPEAQAEVIEKALEAAGINPRTISYLEAHGTGTILGDPIEITGLTKVYQKYSRAKSYCVIGSVKSNIGHAEAAAGIASLTKVILQMRHHWIVPALYAENLNPNIDFAETPFFIQHQGSEWRRPVIREEGREVECPRRAGVSSFGAGGANAHIIVEEYQESYTIAYTGADTVAENYGTNELLVILSAMTREQLREYAGKLLAFIKEAISKVQPDGKPGPVNLADLAYTLQVGREELKERLAVVAVTGEELIRKLNIFWNGGQMAGIFTGNSRSEELDNERNNDDPSVEQAVLQKDLVRIARFWVEGQKIDWRKLYTGTKPRRISLPTYPFNLKKYWLTPPPATPEPVPGINAGIGSFELTGVMTRIDDRVTEFATTLSLDACEFLKAHVLFGQAVLSGPTQLAMLFEAVYRAFGSVRVELNHMDFIKPIVVTSGVALILKLKLEYQNQTASYRFQFQSRPAGGEWNIHSAGQLTRISGAIDPDNINPGDWQPPELKAVPVDAFYARLEEMGYRFEDSFKCITDLKAGNGFASSRIINFREINAAIKKSHTGKRGAPAKVMEPGIIDSCIQMLLPTLPEPVIAAKPHSIYVPVYLSDFTLWEAFQDEMYCYGRRISWDDQKETFLGSILIKGNQGEFIGKIDKFRLKRVDSKKLLDRQTPVVNAATGGKSYD
jgi:FkbH-like protein